MIALNQSTYKPAPVTLSKAEEHTVCRDLEQWHGLVLRMQYGCCIPFWKSRESAQKRLATVLGDLQLLRLSSTEGSLSRTFLPMLWMSLPQLKCQS